MKRKLTTWATRKLPPLTVEELERHLDLLARLMEAAGKNAEGYLPIWRRVERELLQRSEAETILAAARSRLTRSTDRTAARSS